MFSAFHFSSVRLHLRFSSSNCAVWSNQTVFRMLDISRGSTRRHANRKSTRVNFKIRILFKFGIFRSRVFVCHYLFFILTFFLLMSRARVAIMPGSCALVLCVFKNFYITRELLFAVRFSFTAGTWLVYCRVLCSFNLCRVSKLTRVVGTVGI